MANRPAVTYSIANRPPIAREIIRARLDRGPSHCSLAKLAGITSPALCHIETGLSKPRPATLERIRAALAAAEAGAR